MFGVAFIDPESVNRKFLPKVEKVVKESNKNWKKQFDNQKDKMFKYDRYDSR